MRDLVSPARHPYVQPSNLERESAGNWSDEAIWQFWTPALDALLAGGANPNARSSTEGEFRVHVGHRQDSSATTPLHLAISVAGELTRRTTAEQEIGLTRFRAENSIKNILKLIGAGADRHALNVTGESAYGHCTYDLRGRRVSQEIVMPLHASIDFNAPELCLSLLEAGINSAENTRRQTAWRNAELASPECLAVITAWESRRTLQAIAKRARLQSHQGGL